MTAADMQSRAAEIVLAGGVIAFKTDTFYGLGADPLNAKAVRKIFELKGREAGKPILLLISDTEQIDRFLATTSATFNLLAKQFWPGPLTLIGKAKTDLPDELTASTGTVGLRLPDDDHVRRLVRRCGGALTATSANPSQQGAARNAAEVQNYFGADVDLILDDGHVEVTAASTVVDATTANVMVVREGLISEEQIRAALHNVSEG